MAAGLALDHVFVERLWRTVKFEEVVRAKRLRQLLHWASHLTMKPAVPSVVPYAKRRHGNAPSKACRQYPRSQLTESAAVRQHSLGEHQVEPGLGWRVWSTQVNA